jgi:hypothetical protein
MNAFLLNKYLFVGKEFLEIVEDTLPGTRKKNPYVVLCLQETTACDLGRDLLSRGSGYGLDEQNDLPREALSSHAFVVSPWLLP